MPLAMNLARYEYSQDDRRFSAHVISSE
jgi:hypothetical protein